MFVCVHSVCVMSEFCCEGAHLLGRICGCQRTTSDLDSQLLSCCFFQCVYQDGCPRASRGFSSLFQFPRGVLGLQTCETTFGLYWVPGIYIQVTRLYPEPRLLARKCINVFLPRSLIPALFLCAL